MHEFDSDDLRPDARRRLQESARCSEHRLMLAVLRDAVECYQKYAHAREPGGRNLFSEAARWIDSSDLDWPFSYENICETLGLDPAYVRRGLSRWSHRNAVSAAPPARLVSLADRRALERAASNVAAHGDTTLMSV